MRLDKVGNRTSLIADGVTTTYTYDAANELTAESSPSEDAAYTYDGHGNQIARAVDGGDTTYYDCDARNNIAAIWTRDDAITPNYFNYDGDSVRTQIIDSTGETNYTWDGLNIMLERDDSGDLKRAYSHGQTPVHGAFSLLEVEDDQGDAFAYHMDQVGGVKDLTDASEDVAKSYEFSPFGRVLDETGATPNPFVFPAIYLQPTGLPSLRLSPARCYSVGSSTFLHRDRVPNWSGASSYGYASSRPTGTIDPTGLWGENVHRQATEMRAINLGYPLTAAGAIGEADIGVDGGATSVSPISGDQRYHFDRNRGSGPDTRMQLFQHHLRLAKKACTWRGAEVRRDDPGTAVNQLGTALHPYQDWVAHGDYGFYDLGEIVAIHNEWSPQRDFGFWESSYPDLVHLDAVNGPSGRPAGRAMHTILTPGGLHTRLYAIYARGNVRYRLTDRMTRDVLRDFEMFQRIWDKSVRS